MATPTLKPGDVVLAQTRGAVVGKNRPSVVLSTDLYHKVHIDVVVALVTSQLWQATTPTDYILQDWAAAGLHNPSAVRVYLDTTLAASVRRIGRLSDHDWQEVQARLRLALAVI
jgi:mRNA-degrading endonuclease toxin of MazEF toxin-antitoxin module